MSERVLVFYGSYRSDRMGIRLAQFVVEGFRARGDDVELIDAKEVGLPMLDRMYKEYEKGTAPDVLERLATLGIVPSQGGQPALNRRHGVRPCIPGHLS